MTKYRVVVVSREHLDFIYAGPEEREHTIYVYVHDDHYDLITSMSAFYNKSYFCENCFKGYNAKNEHTCYNACKMCRSVECPLLPRMKTINTANVATATSRTDAASKIIGPTRYANDISNANTVKHSATMCC